MLIGMLYERTHSREIGDYGGFGKLAPIYAGFLTLFCLAAAGFPGLNSFVGEFLIIGGAFETQKWLGAAAIWGVAGAPFTWISMGSNSSKNRQLSSTSSTIVCTLAVVALGSAASRAPMLAAAEMAWSAISSMTN